MLELSFIETGKSIRVVKTFFFNDSISVISGSYMLYYEYITNVLDFMIYYLSNLLSELLSTTKQKYIL